MRGELWVIAGALSAFVGVLVWIFACLGQKDSTKINQE